MFQKFSCAQKDSFAALQALFNSLSPNVPGAGPSSQLSPLQLKHLADKIDEVLGGGGDSEGSQMNEKGEVRLQTCVSYMH